MWIIFVNTWYQKKRERASSLYLLFIQIMFSCVDASVAAAFTAADDNGNTIELY